ncbi:hypothetical protein AUJ17_00280 [Candidatus Micrarchaeota archaeon CG1_02_47_40]|nr:MAG: hypothetical protein AUJ17_00280 [Candidatus Micrarchaeota archaeon CG1_02_47_40]
MSLENLGKEIGKSARERAGEIVRKADASAAEMIGEAKKKASTAIEAAREEAKKAVVEQRAELVAGAHLEAGKLISRAKDDAVEDGLKIVWHEFARGAKSRDYPKTLQKLVREGTREVGGTCIVRIRKEDVKAAKSAGINFEQKGFAECSGGALVESSDGKVCSHKTFEALFEEKRDVVRSLIYEKLFGK